MWNLYDVVFLVERGWILEMDIEVVKKSLLNHFNIHVHSFQLELGVLVEKNEQWGRINPASIDYGREEVETKYEKWGRERTQTKCIGWQMKIRQQGWCGRAV